MTFDVRSNLLSWSSAIAIALIAFGASLGIYSAIATPPDLAQRRDALEARLKQIHHAEKMLVTGRIYPAGTLCKGDIGAASEALRRRLASAGNASGAKLQDAFVAVGVPSANAPDLTPIDFTIEARGSHPGVMSALGSLAQSQPEIFLERVELTSQVTELTLRVKGEVLCWTGV